jgi:hypothetical protein
MTGWPQARARNGPAPLPDLAVWFGCPIRLPGPVARYDWLARLPDMIGWHSPGSDRTQ